MRNKLRFSIRFLLVAVMLAAGMLWLFLPLIRNEAYAEYTIVDVAITQANEIQIVADTKTTKNCSVGFSSPVNPVIGATPGPSFVFPGWAEKRQTFYIGKLNNQKPSIEDFEIEEGQQFRLDENTPELIVYKSESDELKLSFKRLLH